MLPDFDVNGNLPPGIHQCSRQELESRFGANEHRKRIMGGLIAVLEALKRAGCSTAYIDGSFTTEKPNPEDFDGCYDKAGLSPASLRSVDPVLLDFSNKRAAQKAKYMGEMFPSDAIADGAGRGFIEFFSTDRNGNKKGIVKIDLRTF